ncbi:histone-lysine N-methyltransferase SUVR3 isoform X2 [Vigna radiata var. radiata]|uniref:Histone-lysine N-methyltransferase SUVR3 isoform X2 n=1 Tax=Vigna radiata var. radiata TaxID=3916 RepID=A0A1S3W111_VIGRR|nr:histone-lysine N-methyltransferase SUVR3 isoform X2 [Vigna radiata var. radiata]
MMYMPVNLNGRVHERQMVTAEESGPPKRCNAREPPLLQCAELVLPYLNPSELANVSLTCKSLFKLSRTITIRRASDASRTFETLPIPFLNTVDSHPYAPFLYTRSLVLSSPLSLPRQPWGSSAVSPSAQSRLLRAESVGFVDGEGRAMSGCECEACDGGECPCAGLDGLDDVGRECGPGCRCGPECGNRLTRNGLAVRVKIVRHRRKGWGLHADQLIAKSELLTTKEAQRRHQYYDELASQGRFSPALLVVREHLPSGKACLRLNIDATRLGNIARFVNHSCDGGNLSTKLVRSSGALFPRLCFFASKDILVDEELTFSYGEIRERSKGLPCFCNSPSCVGTLPSEDT